MEQKSKALPTAGLIVVKNNGILLAYSNNKKAWYLPGGKVDPGESSLQSLQREIREELNLTLQADRLTYYCHISAPAYGEHQDIVMEQDCYIYDLQEDVRPGNEIGGVKFFDYESYRNEAIQVIGVLDIFERLTQDGILA